MTLRSRRCSWVLLLAVGCGDDLGGDEVGSDSDDVATTDTSTDDDVDPSDSDGPDTGADTGERFALSGQLVGLQGGSVTVEDGDGLTLVLDADGPFEWPASFAAGSSYALSVAAQPSGPEQGCVIDDAAGSVDGPIDTVVIRCITPIRHVVILGIDGLGGQFVAAPPTPELDALMTESAWTLAMQNAVPTWSATNWMSMINGTTPDQHGVLNNQWSPGDSSPAPTLFAELRGARPAAKIGIFHDWADFDVLVEPGVADVLTHPGDEHQTMDAALAWAIAEQPDLLFIHLDHVDHAGHFFGWASDPYNQAVTDADALLGQLRTGLEAVDMWPYTALIIAADHGGVGLFHSEDTPAERAIPFIVHTPQGPTGPLGRELRVWDIAATAATLLDIDGHPDWVGRAVLEAIAAPELLPPPIQPDPDEPLPYRLVGAYDPLYDDTGSGAFADVSFWRPQLPPGYLSFGDVAVAGHAPPLVDALVVAADHPALVLPVGYEQIWSDTGSGADQQVTLWNPLPPLGRYVCPGQVAKPDHAGPPALDAVRCIHQSYIQSAVVEFTWDDTGSGATWDGSVWSCRPGVGTDLVHPTFFSRRNHQGPGFNECAGLRSLLAVPG